ncbi:MAG TPA: DUF3422 family protein [Candidatus Wujingus californicus]|uniref:DUF3422 family protein n=1 Tax=Candidatus Wujingus californicus TaxID=3367618 RepID=UPI0040298506
MDIRVYRISTCHWCDKVEALLKRYNVGFKSIVIDLMEGEEQERAIAEAYHLSKQRSFPVTYIDGACIIGFHESRIRSILKLQAGEDEDKESKIKSAGEISSLTLDGVEYRKTIEELRQWLEREAISHGYKINPDKNVIEEIIIGLARNEKRYRYKACPCRLATGKYQLDCDIICPCSYCFLDVEKNGRCYCTLFVSDRYIAGDPSLPQYVPDSRERDDIREKIAKDVRKEEEASIVDTPYYKVHTKVVGFLQDLADRNKAKVIYEKIVNGLDISSSSVQWGEDTSHVSTTIEDIKVDIKLKQDADSYVYIIACSGIKGKRTTGEKIFRRIDFTGHKNKLFECYIVIWHKTLFDVDEKDVLPQFMSYKNKYSSELKFITGGFPNPINISAWFEAEDADKDTFLLDSVSPGGYMFDKIVEDIVMLETDYNLLGIEKQRYILSMDKLDVLESKVVSKMGTISMSLPKSQPETLKAWLHELSNNFGEISGITEEARQRMNYTILKRDAIRKILKDWGENSKGQGYPSVSKFFLDKVEGLSEQYQRLFTRIDSIRREMTDLITMLRTKIDLFLQEQSLELQRSVDETTKTQMIMQHTVEGLSVIVLSYYIIHLAGFIFESLEVSHVIRIPVATAKAIFVPIAIAISWYLTFRARQFIKKHTKNKSK